jgi:predicted transcriptional regulator
MNKDTRLVDESIELLKNNGPMNAKDIAAHLGLPNARTLSMKLQWASDRVSFSRGKWAIVDSKQNSESL